MANKEVKKPIANKDYKSEKQLAKQEERRKAMKSTALKKVLIPVVAVVVALALVITGSIVAYNSAMNSGALSRSRVAMQSENYKITNAMMSYYLYDQYYTYVGTDEDAASKGINSKKSLKKQDCSLYTSGTWYDYFLSAAANEAETMLINLEAAKKDGVTLSAEELAEVTTAAKSCKPELYGRGLTEKDIRTAIEYRTLADKYQNSLQDKIAAELNVGDGEAASKDAKTEEDLAKFGDIGEYVKGDNFAAFTQFEYVKYTVAYSVVTEADEDEEAPAEDATPAPEASEAPAEDATPAPEASEAPAEEATPAPEASEAPAEEPTEAPSSGLPTRDEAKATADALVAALGETTTLDAFRTAVNTAVGEGKGDGILLTVGTTATADNGIVEFAASEDSAAGQVYLKDGAAFEDATAGTFTVYALLEKPHLKNDRAANYYVISVDANTVENEDDEAADDTAIVAEADRVANEILKKMAGLSTKEELDALAKEYESNEMVKVSVNEANTTYASSEANNAAWLFGKNRDYSCPKGDINMFGAQGHFLLIRFNDYAADAEWYSSAYNTVLQNRVNAHYAEATKDSTVIYRYNTMNKIPVRK